MSNLISGSFSLSVFVQDDIKLNPRFTLNLGLRWELDQFPTDKNGNMAGFLAQPHQGRAGPIRHGSRRVVVSRGRDLAGYIVASNFTGPLFRQAFTKAATLLPRTKRPKTGFAPRIGFAWQPMSSNRLVVRAGAGYVLRRAKGGHEALRPLDSVPRGRHQRSADCESIQSVCDCPGTRFRPATASSDSFLAG